MFQENILDNSTGWFIFLVSLVLMLLINYFGYRLGIWHKKKNPALNDSSTAEIMGALFGVLGFTLAFLFGMSLTRIEHKKEMVQDESNAILASYQKSQLLHEPQKSLTGKQLITYANLRLQLIEHARSERDINELNKGIALSEIIQDSLLKEGLASSQLSDTNAPAFIESVTTLTILHVKRISKSKSDRIPMTLKFLMYLISILGLGAMGYGAGIKGGRALVPNIILVLVFNIIIGIIIDMDHPANSFFKLSQEPMKDAITRMSSMKI